jgi:putative endonuclease
MYFKRKYFVYMILCSDNKLYTGITNDIDRRFAEHEEGIDPESFTYSRRPLKLVWAEAFDSVHLAIQWEKRIKKWSRAKKDALINEDWDKLKFLAECKNGSTSKRLIGDKDYIPKRVRYAQQRSASTRSTSLRAARHDRKAPNVFKRYFNDPLNPPL